MKGIGFGGIRFQQNIGFNAENYKVFVERHPFLSAALGFKKLVCMLKTRLSMHPFGAIVLYKKVVFQRVIKGYIGGIRLGPLCFSLDGLPC